MHDDLIIGLLMIAIVLVAAASWVTGLVVAFSASILIGIVALMFFPVSMVFGVCYFFGTNVPEILQAAANLPV